MRPLGFLLPDGKLYSCKHYEHLDCAYRIVERSYPDFPLNSKLRIVALKLATTIPFPRNN